MPFIEMTLTMKLGDIRTTFLNYFQNQGHEVVPSSSLVPKNDPTLLFTNSGMVQFKDVFTGVEKRPYTRATSSQKCIRAGGKHNDLDNVGYTARHHTFFEMLGNFSFGDYFKENAINFAWELITKEFSLSKDRLLVTVYHTDDEAIQLWKKIAGFSDDRIIRIPTKDNFWSMGDTGPCGPCTEIFYDHGEHIAGGPPGSKDEDGDRFTEIWNLVFMQFEQFQDGRMIDLPQKSVDTGMGLERVGAVLQGVHSNYDTDLFQSLIHASKELTSNSDMKQSHQVIADHLRSCSFLMAEGVLPSNEGRGYVLRRIMRRAMRHAHLLGAKDPLMHQLVPTLLETMGSAYPELKRAESVLISTFKNEEEKFRETLERGLKLLQDETEKLSISQSFPGDIAFKLYDTFGFPVDLTADVLKTQGRALDMDGFDHAMEAQKETARASWTGSGDTKNDTLWITLKEKIGATEFLGYEEYKKGLTATLKAIVLDGQCVDAVDIDMVTKETIIDFVFDRTPFYGESGGQMGDHGVLFSENVDAAATVIKTFKPMDDLIIHRVTNLRGDAIFTVGESCSLNVDPRRRQGLRQHHSATHLLHEALRHVLGDHVVQKGSLVEEDRFRFDFTHTGPLTAQDIEWVEDRVNGRIQRNNTVSTNLTTPEKAMEDGAMALFGEKYGDTVRVVTMGESVELCGGTHVKATGDIGFFKITSESGVASGIRRIEAVAGMSALEYVRKLEQSQHDMANLLKASPSQIKERLEKVLEDQKSLHQHISTLKQKLASGDKANTSLETINSVSLMIQHLKDYDPKEIKGLIDRLKKDIGSGIIFISNVSEDHKVSLYLGVTNDRMTHFKANDHIKTLSACVNGQGGGGRPDLAQAGGSDASGIKKAEEALKKIIATVAFSA